MELFTVLSKKEQVAEAIKKKITSGEIPPGAKLTAVRELGKLFSVSTRVIVDSFDILEREKLIYREQGRGIFVRKRNSCDLINICLFGYRISNKNHPYFSMLTQIALPPYFREGHSFIVRTTPAVSEFDADRFKYELKSMEQYLNVDCFLINVPSLSKDQIEICMNMNVPVIFIGDLSSGKYPKMPFNQISGNNVLHGQGCVQELAKLTKKSELTIFSGSTEHFFYSKFYEGALAACKELNIRMNFVEFPKGASALPAHQKNKLYYEKVMLAKEKGWLDVPCLNSGLSQDLLLNALASCDAAPELYASEIDNESFDSFFDAIYDRINALVANPKDCKKLELNLKLKLRKTQNEK